MTMARKNRRLLAAPLVFLLVLSAAGTSLAEEERTKVKPGFNIFSKSQDIELGRNAARDAEKQLPLLSDEPAGEYLGALGHHLAQFAPGYNYPYEFKIVNDANINAFALPGGFIYMNRGTIEAAENEAQLAGVMAHEIAHVALRHGTNQVSKAVIAQAPLMILSGMIGRNGGVVGQLTQLGVGVGASLFFLKYSRDAETQADVLGAQILHDAGYDPREMAKFFDMLARKSSGGAVQFFSSHPNPENRQGRIQEEVARLGGVPEDARKDSENFYLVRERLHKMPPPPVTGKSRSDRSNTRRPNPNRRPDLPSSRMVRYRDRNFILQYPENWEVTVAESRFTLAPPEGLYPSSGGEAVAYGLVAGQANLENPGASLDEAADLLLARYRRADSSLRVQSRQRTRLAGLRAIAVRFTGESPIPGERESDWLFVLRHNDRFLYLVFVVPESEEHTYRRTFQNILDSLQLR